MTAVVRWFSRRDTVLDAGPYSTEMLYATLLTAGGTPVRRKVRLHDEITGALVREGWTDAATGGFRFQNLRAGRFFAIGFDHTDTYNGEVITGIVVPAP